VDFRGRGGEGAIPMYTSGELDLCGEATWSIRRSGDEQLDREREKHLSLTELSQRLNRDISRLSVSARRLVETSTFDSHLSREMEELKSAFLRNSKSQPPFKPR